MGKIRIGLIEKDELFRKGIMTTIHKQDDAIVMFGTDDGEEFLKFLQNYPDRIDIVLMDLSPNGNYGIETLKILTENYPAIRVIIMTMLDEDKLISEAVISGAKGYMLKSADPKDFQQAIRTVFGGQTYFQPFVRWAAAKKKEGE